MRASKRKIWQVRMVTYTGSVFVFVSGITKKQAREVADTAMWTRNIYSAQVERMPNR